MRLGPILRAAIIASALWIGGGTVYFADRQNAEATRLAGEFFSECFNRKPEMAMSVCTEGQATIYDGHTKQLAGGLWGSALARALGVWLTVAIAVTVLYWSARWILAGRDSRASS